MNELLGASGQATHRPNKDMLHGHWQQAEEQYAKRDAGKKDQTEIKGLRKK
ncbi:hypothetical protein GCM10027084_28880 [Pseudoxanthomonas sangjuensis]